jgi:DNA-binding MarR family transcriptional regulator
MYDNKPVKTSSLEHSFHEMNDMIMQVAKIYVRQHNKMQNFCDGIQLCRAEIHTIQAIGNHEGINISELASLFEVSKPTISERTKKLIRMKLVKKQLKDGNNKEVMLTLTDKGWSAYQSHEKQHKEIYKLFKKHFGIQSDDFLKSFGKEISQFYEFLDDVRKKTAYFQ